MLGHAHIVANDLDLTACVQTALQEKRCNNQVASFTSTEVLALLAYLLALLCVQTALQEKRCNNQVRAFLVLNYSFYLLALLVLKGVRCLLALLVLKCLLCLRVLLGLSLLVLLSTFFPLTSTKLTCTTEY